jgi:hypothetical protein
MLNTLIRLGMGLIGLAMLLEVFLPQVYESATVDQHTISTRRDHSNSTGATETDYKLHFFGSKIESCDVGLNAYNVLRDGDAVTVRYSKIFRHCTSIDKDGSNIYASRGWRLFYIIGGAFSLLAAFGAFPSFEFQGRQIY